MPGVLRLAVSAAFLVIIASGQTPQAVGVKPSVGVFLDFDSVPNAAALQEMESEVTKLLKPSGVSLDWRYAKENQGTESFAGLVVLKFKGTCRAERWSQPFTDFGSAGQTLTLGSTKVENGRVLPFSQVECDQVRKALSYIRPNATSGDRQRAMGMALGRVVAHELYHILARTTSHAAAGLARATESLQDLITAPAMSFLETDSVKIAQ